MHVVSPMDIPALRAGLHLLGWATDDARVMAQDGATWFVAFAERGSRRLRGEGPTEAAAWAEIGWQAIDDAAECERACQESFHGLSGIVSDSAGSGEAMPGEG